MFVHAVLRAASQYDCFKEGRYLEGGRTWYNVAFSSNLEGCQPRTSWLLLRDMLLCPYPSRSSNGLDIICGCVSYRAPGLTRTCWLE